MLEKEFEELTTSGPAVAPVAPTAGGMTSRERFLRCMHFQTVDRVPHWEFGYWNETIARFHREGLPAAYDNNGKIETYFGCEHPAYIPVHLGAVNPRETVVVEERGRTRVERDDLGTLREVNTDGTDSIPHYLEFPVRDHATWRAFRDEFLPVNHEKRIPPDTPTRAAALLRAEVPVGISLGSYLGWIRNWVGFENLAVMFYDNPDLIEEMVDHVASIATAVLGKVLPHATVDFASGWEDICYNSGPICSPDMFQGIVIRRLAPVLRLLRQHGVDVIYTDCDGDISRLVPLWLAAGQNGMFPIEVRGGTDPVKLRNMYGHEILLIGGFDKMALLKGKPAILAELKRLAPVVADGGFIPHVDHRVQADIPYENYRYYVREKLAMLGWKKTDIEAVEPLRSVGA